MYSIWGWLRSYKYIVKKVLQGPLRKDCDPICVHGNL